MKQSKGCPLEIWGIVFPWSPAKVLQIPSSLFCNKSMFALLKEKKKDFGISLYAKQNK